VGCNSLTRIHERNRELGLLRAIGQDRAQTRAMVRWESVIVAIFGTVGGIAMGTFLRWGVMRRIAGSGVLAGIRPARRTARLFPFWQAKDALPGVLRLPVR
jgi:putative ABC transport system permease protein